jgi:hypothetical protein
MAQSQVTVPTVGAPGGAAPWDYVGGFGEQALEIWSRLPATPVSQPPAAVTQKLERTDIPHVLSAWRAAERRLADHIEASPMRSAVLSEIARLRAEYQRLFAQAMK